MPFGSPAGENGSQRTRRWRKPDSNFWSLRALVPIAAPKMTGNARCRVVIVFKLEGAGGDVGGLGNPVRVYPELGNRCPHPDDVDRRIVEVVQLRRRIGSKQPTQAIHWAGQSRSASKPDNQPCEKGHLEPAIGSRKVRASGIAAAQRAAIAQNPCAPKRSKIGPQASVRRAVAIPMPTVP
jgi:hypothetical protein